MEHTTVGWPGHNQMRPFSHRVRRVLPGAAFVLLAVGALIVGIGAGHADTINVVTDTNSADLTALSFTSPTAVNSYANGSTVFIQNRTSSYMAGQGFAIPVTGNGGELWDMIGGSDGTQVSGNAVFNTGTETLDFLNGNNLNGTETLSLYSGANGTGTLLDTISLLQGPILYTITDQTGDFGSAIVTASYTNGGGVMGDNISFALQTVPDVTSTPLPGAAWLLLSGLVGLGWLASRRHALA